MEDASKASIFAELADKATDLPKELRQEAMRAAQDTLMGSPPGAEPHSAALYCLGRLCSHDPSLVSPALCNLLARCMQSALQDDDHLELQEAASSLQCCMRAVHESAGDFWSQAPAIVAALLETATLPLCHVLADPLLRPTDTRIAPLSQLLKTMYELLPDWRSETLASEHRTHHDDWDADGSLRVSSALCRLCRCLMTVCLAEFRRPSTVFILMNNAWQLLMRAVGMPLLKRAVVSSAVRGDDESGFSQVPSQLQTCVLEPLLAYFPRAMDAIVKQRSAAAHSATASGVSETQQLIKIARFALSQFKAFATVYGEWAAHEAAKRSAAAIELEHAMATLCLSLQTSMPQQTAMPGTVQSDVEGSHDKLSESLSTCAILLLRGAEQMSASNRSPSPMTLLRAWAAMAEADLAASDGAFAMVKASSGSSPVGADAALRALLLAQILHWSAATKLPHQEREAAASLLLPLIFRLLGKVYAAVLTHRSAAATGTLEDVPLELGGPCCTRQPLEAVRSVLFAYVHACADGPVRGSLLAALLNASLARPTAPRLLAAELWCHAVQQLSVAEAEKQMLVLWELASRLQSCDEAAFPQHAIVRLLSSGLLALPVAATSAATKAMSEYLLAASASAKNATVDSDPQDANPLFVALALLCEVRCLSVEASAENSRNPFAADGAAWLRELLDACQLPEATDAFRMRLLRAACALYPFVARGGLITPADTERLRLALCEQLRAGHAVASAAAASFGLCLCVLPLPILHSVADVATNVSLESASGGLRKMDSASMLSALLQRESNPQTLQGAADGVRRLLSCRESEDTLADESGKEYWLARLQSVRAAALFTQIAPEESVATLLGELQASGEQQPLCDFLQQSTVASASVDAISKDVHEEQRVLTSAAEYVARHAKRRKVARTVQPCGGVHPQRTKAADAKPAQHGALKEKTSVGACAIELLAAALDSLRQDAACLQDNTSVDRLNQLLGNPHLAGADVAELATLQQHVDNWMADSIRTGINSGSGFS